MSEHTPEPWTVGSSPAGVYVGAAGSNYHNQPSVSVWTAAPEDKAQCLADARLIAAAPALLEACKAALFPAGDTPEQVEAQLRAAIKLAEGQR